MQRELELKVQLSSSDMKRLGGELRYDELAIGSAATKKLRTGYFDTPGRNLQAAGFSLRLRRQDGRWLQTIQSEQQAADGVSNPVELEGPVDTGEPDLAKITGKKIKRAVQEAVKGASLHPVFETVIRRTTRKINTQKLAADEGVARTGEGSSELGAAELELKAGRAEDLLLAVEKLLGGHELKLAGHSEDKRGYRVAVGKRRASAEPEKARLARITRKNSSAEAFSAILASAIRQIVVNRQAVLRTDCSEGAHQLRIGLRRLRSALRALRPLVDGGSLRAFERSARDMGRCVGMLRDADVLITDIQAPMERVASDKRGFAELRDALVRDQRAKRDEVRTALRGPAWIKLQLYLTLWPRTLEGSDELDKPITKHACRVLCKAWKKPAKLGRNLDQLDTEHRHEMRKTLKELRYQTEFFAPLFKRRDTRYFIEQLKALPDVFGYINDAGMARRLIEVQHEQQAGVNAARAASYALGRHEAEAAHVWRGAGKLWKELRRSPRFWM
jgi:inorganic triphosphatase YgiF